MKKPTRIVVLLISLSMIISYFVPMWYIDLEAPQYPEGLGMKIWLNKITGDLNTINALNHYIGMKTIHPESIAELKIMPYLIGILILTGLIVVMARKKWLYMAWASFFVVVGLVGLVDFYMWGYDYGHNLDPRAAIKVPGMSYQPPVLGSKQLLNFTAHSYPDIGGGIIMGGALLALLFAFFEMKNLCVWCKLKETKLYTKVLEMHHKPAAAIILAVFFLASCNTGPQPIHYGQDQCALCKMIITDKRYGCELITKKGKIHKFDSIECMIDFTHSGKVKQGNIHSLLITDFTAPGNFADATNAFYLVSRNLPSPMGANLTAFGSKSGAEKYHAEKSGKIYTWKELKQELDKKISEKY